jgi:hypothetical protein
MDSEYCYAPPLMPGCFLQPLRGLVAETELCHLTERTSNSSSVCTVHEINTFASFRIFIQLSVVKCASPRVMGVAASSPWTGDHLLAI